MYGRPCSKCGGDAPLWLRKAHGQWGYASFCIICQKEDQRIKNDRSYAKNKEKILKRQSEIRKGNPKYIEMARISYWKHRESRLKQKKDKYKSIKKLTQIGTTKLYSRKRRLIYEPIPQDHPVRLFEFTRKALNGSSR